MPKTTPAQPEPPLIKGTFLLGHLLNAKNEGVHFYSRMNREHGDALRLKIAHRTYYLFLNPDYNHQILVDKPDQFIKGKQYNPLRLLLGNGLLTTEGKKWNGQRRMLNPLFGREGMDILITHIHRISKKYSENVKTDVDINWTKYMFDYTLEVAVASFFGTNFPEEKRIHFTEASHHCIRFISKRMSNFYSPPLILPLKEHRSFRKFFHYLKSSVEEIYNLRLKNPETSPSRDMLDLLMRAEDEVNGEKKSLSRDEVWDQILSFMIAGHETTALTMSWLFYNLAKHPEAQEKIAEECLKNNYRFDNSLALAQYPYLMATLHETMRLYPAGWIIARDIKEDAVVGQFKVKKGRVLAVSPFVTQRDPRWWKNPDDFIPERFLEGHELFNTAPKNAFIPFSIGRRNCIGSRFALLEMALFCLYFFKSHRVSTQQDNVGMKGFVTLKSDKPIFIKVSNV